MSTPTAPGSSFVPSPALGRELHRRADAPDVDLWMPGAREYRRGDAARVEFRARDDAYVTIVRVDTDGRLRILWPQSPFDDGWVERDRSVKVPGRRGGSFTVDDVTGLGYVFAIASFDRFDFRRFARNGDWDERSLGGRVHGDPFLAVDRLAERMLWDERSPYATAYAEYYVERHVDYPRYLCNDCHTSRAVRYRDPYDHYCTQFRVVIYNDPYYYPYRYYPGTRTVYVRRPRYELKQPTPGYPITRSTAIEYRRRDEAVGDRRRPGSPTGDANLPGPRRPPGGDEAAPGGTRPGGDTPDGSRPGRRRGQEADGPGNSNNAPGHTGDLGPRREPPGGGGGSGGNGQGDDHWHTPRSERGTPRDDAAAAHESRPDDARDGDARREGSADEAREARRAEPGREPAPETAREPSRDSRADRRHDSGSDRASPPSRGRSEAGRSEGGVRRRSP